MHYCYVVSDTALIFSAKGKWDVSIAWASDGDCKILLSLLYILPYIVKYFLGYILQ